MGPGFKPLVQTFGRYPPGSGLVRRVCPRSMGGKCVINAQRRNTLLDFVIQSESAGSSSGGKKLLTKLSCPLLPQQHA